MGILVGLGSNYYFQKKFMSLILAQH